MTDNLPSSIGTFHTEPIQASNAGGHGKFLDRMASRKPDRDVSQAYPTRTLAAASIYDKLCASLAAGCDLYHIGKAASVPIATFA
jgi:hypothetical protein